MKYSELKERTRKFAMDIQHRLSDSRISYGELRIIQIRLEFLGRRYGLLREFRENGLL